MQQIVFCEWKKKTFWISFAFRCKMDKLQWAKFDLQMKRFVHHSLWMLLFILNTKNTTFRRCEYISMSVFALANRQRQNSQFTNHTIQRKREKNSVKQNADRIYFWFIWINNYNGIYWHKSNEWETADEAAAASAAAHWFPIHKN